MFGLHDSDIDLIKSTIRKHPSVTQIILYGSRAKGTYKPGSDIDLTLKGNVDLDTVSKIHYELNELSSLPYFFDISAYQLLDNPSLIEHIDRVGVEF